MVHGRPTQGRTGIHVFSSRLSPRGARRETTKNKGVGGSLCRQDLNDPPTAVGGIPGPLTLPIATWVTALMTSTQTRASAPRHSRFSTFVHFEMIPRIIRSLLAFSGRAAFLAFK